MTYPKQQEFSVAPAVLVPSLQLRRASLELGITERERRKTMALLAAIGALILCACALAALRSKRVSGTEKVKNLKLS